MKKLIFSIALMLMAVASHAQSIGVYIFDNDGDFTNIRNAPKGKIVFKLPSREGVMIGVDKVVNGWWHLVSDKTEDNPFQGTIRKISSGFLIYR